ncbi:RICIN domain-containing protein [Trebonia kvetii]|nr:RICIN domain-containing protein [Trebonia kvetii]
MSRSEGMTASLGAAALLAAGAIAGLSPGAAHAASGPAVSVWETTANQSQLLAPQAGAAFNAGNGSASQTITVNPATTYRSVTGFGASFTDSSAWLIANSPLRSQIMTKLFSPTSGIGLDFLRQPIGASDFSQSLFSYDDLPSGQTDPTLAKFSTAHDNAYILPVLKQALSLNPDITIMATPWSPPGWMKSSGSMIGGSLNSADYQVFADYLAKFIQAYDAAGVPISLITAQNADTSSAHTFNVDENGQYFTYTLPARAVATFIWTPGTTSTGGGISSSTWYEVVNTNSGDCVDDTNGSTSNGTAVQQWACSAGSTNQEWQFQPTSGGYYQVVTRNAPSEAWDVTGGPSATGNGTPIQLWSTTGGTNQQWLPTLQSDGSYTFTARNSGNECLDVTNRSTGNGTQLQQWACTAADTAQTFRLVPES